MLNPQAKICEILFYCELAGTESMLLALLREYSAVRLERMEIYQIKMEAPNNIYEIGFTVALRGLYNLEQRSRRMAIYADFWKHLGLGLIDPYVWGENPLNDARAALEAGLRRHLGEQQQGGGDGGSQEEQLTQEAHSGAEETKQEPDSPGVC